MKDNKQKERDDECVLLGETQNAGHKGWQILGGLCRHDASVCINDAFLVAPDGAGIDNVVLDAAKGSGFHLVQNFCADRERAPVTNVSNHSTLLVDPVHQVDAVRISAQAVGRESSRHNKNGHLFGLDDCALLLRGSVVTELLVCCLHGQMKSTNRTSNNINKNINKTTYHFLKIG